jgi:UDP-glucose 4-epimerase
MRVLITGSSGQIGTNLALALLDAGHVVLGVDRRPNPWTAAFPAVLHDLLAPLPSGAPAVSAVTCFAPNAVVHLAAHPKVHELVQHPQRALENIQTTFVVLEYCRARKVPIVFASSREVYGNAGRVPVSEDSASFATSESPYAASKIAAEGLIHAYARSYGQTYLIARLSNVYGRYDNDLDRLERVLPLWIHRIGRGQPITVYGPEKTLDFTYVDDCVSGLVRGVQALVTGQIHSETVNLASGQGRSLLEAARLVAEAVGREPRIAIAPSRPGEVTRYTADLTGARRLLGYDPQVPLEEGIRRAVAWSGQWPTHSALQASSASPTPGGRRAVRS